MRPLASSCILFKRIHQYSATSLNSLEQHYTHSFSNDFWYYRFFIYNRVLQHDDVRSNGLQKKPMQHFSDEHPFFYAQNRSERLGLIHNFEKSRPVPEQHYEHSCLKLEEPPSWWCLMWRLQAAQGWKVQWNLLHGENYEQ